MGERASGYARQADDWYCEPRWCVDALLRWHPFDGPVWDPACGGGNIVEAARARGYDAVGTDIADRGFGGVLDFLASREPLGRTIISNPPFKLAEAFAQHAFALGVEEIALLVRIQFLAGQGRFHDLYAKNAPDAVYVLSQHPSMPPGNRPDISATGGSQDFCWVVWGRTGVMSLNFLTAEECL